MLFLSGLPASSDYGPLTLFQLLIASDVVVIGDVQRLEESQYDLKLTQSFRGANPSETLQILRENVYPHETRSGDFAVGQPITLFGNRAEDMLVRPLGRAAEGEILRDAEHVYVRAMSRPPATLIRVDVPGGEGKAYRIEAEVFDQALEGFFGCYDLTEQEDFSRRCSNQALASYQQSSWLAAHLAGIAERRIRRGD
ncbi:hypothetical protein MUB52_21765 [Roseobacter sp. WL0113]|uniref:Uncharacterized protein n=2 Tax=Roseobacter sinensis TaxID=2931391 RepID=A0ABT3BKJ4_9RHOB|nr:hypothetical protein [Roseobacter sp. WL0113]